MSASPVERFVILMTQVAAYRWVADPDDRSRREPKLLELLETHDEFETESGFQAAYIAVDLMEAYWHCLERDTMALSGGDDVAWVGFIGDGGRQDVMLAVAEELQEKASSADVSRIEQWHEWFNHFMSMDTVLRGSLAGRAWRSGIGSPYPEKKR